MTKSAQMSELQWARLAEDANYGVRRGAWYRVAELTSSDAVVDVNRKQVALPRGSVKLRTAPPRSEEHTSELQSQSNLVCRLLLEKKKKKISANTCSKLVCYKVCSFIVQPHTS